MNKQFGYKELEMSFGVLPIKVGMYTIEGLLKDFGIGLYDIPSLMELHEIEVEGAIFQSELPKDPIKFLRSVLLHSANFPLWMEGKTLYTERDTYAWMEEIGIGSKVAFELIVFFRQAVRSGITPDPKSIDVEETPKKKASQSRSSRLGEKR